MYYICTNKNEKHMETVSFYSETTLNGKFQIMTTLDLVGKGVKKVGSNCITTHKCQIYKGLNNYWVTNLAFEKIKEQLILTRICF